ncbi:ABC-2 type transport system ATP-binding protein [Pseudomonas putida]|nr:ABC-2 type transport system ATP-binding protein [Pseudomonas sp. PvP089]MBP2092286.1 ABC-2 type transport system ATP-binding protein [Pseudomonas sp. PvP088]MBP2221551.1 ABC-2 type transport system ATP-binding protein [Pseudomonas putida]
MSILTLDNLTFSYEGNPLLHNLNLHLSPGEVAGILGSNGAGKTTLFDLICKLRQPDRGNIINRAKNLAYLTQILTPPPPATDD